MEKTLYVDIEIKDKISIYHGIGSVDIPAPTMYTCNCSIWNYHKFWFTKENNNSKQTKLSISVCPIASTELFNE